MTAYTWQFDSLDVYPTYQTVTNAVQSIHWRLTADDGLGHHAQVYGEEATGPIDVNNFIPFANLTPDIIFAWLTNLLGSDGISAITADADRMITDLTSPVIVTMMPPWI